jgi:hypothetical protein
LLALSPRINSDLDILVSDSFQQFGWEVTQQEIERLAREIDDFDSDSPLGYGSLGIQDLPLSFNYYTLGDTLYGEFLRQTNPPSFFFFDRLWGPDCQNWPLTERNHVDLYLQPLCDRSIGCMTPCANACCRTVNTTPAQYTDDDEDPPFSDAESPEGSCVASTPERDGNSLSIWDHNGNVPPGIPGWENRSAVTFAHEFTHMFSQNFRVAGTCNMTHNPLLEEFFGTTGEYLTGAYNSPPIFDVCYDQSFPFTHLIGGAGIGRNNYQMWRSWGVYLLQHFQNGPGYLDDLIHDWHRSGLQGGGRSMYALWNLLKDPKYSKLGCTSCTDDNFRGQYRIQELNNRIAVARWVDNDTFGDPGSPPGQGKWGYFYDFSPGLDIGLFRKIQSAAHCDWTHTLPPVRILGDADVDNLTTVTCYVDSRDTPGCPQECAPRPPQPNPEPFCETATAYCQTAQGCGDPIDLQPWGADIIGFVAGTFSEPQQYDLETIFEIQPVTAPGFGYRYFINVVTYSAAPPVDQLWSSGSSVSSITTYGPYSGTTGREIHIRVPSFGCDLLRSVAFVISLADSLALHPGEDTAAFRWEFAPRMDYYYKYRVIGTGVYPFTCPQPDPQCPFVYVHGPDGPIRDNNILGGTAYSPDGIPPDPEVRDACVLTRPAEIEGGRVRIELREEAQAQSTLDAVGLVAYEVPPDAQLARLADGSEVGFVSGAETFMHVRDGHGRDVTDLVATHDQEVVEAEFGEWIEFDWQANSGIGVEFIVVTPKLKAPTGSETFLEASPGMVLQCQREAGWVDVTRIIPRDREENVCIDTSRIPAAPGETVRLRLLWRSRHQVDWVATCSWIEAEGTTLRLEAAEHSSAGDVGALLREPDGAHAELGPGEAIWLVFSGYQASASTALCLTASGYYVIPNGFTFAPGVPPIAAEEGPLPAPTLEGSVRVFPNPTRNSASIAFNLLSAGEVEVAIYSPQGHLVRKLYDGLVEAGRHELLWDGRNENGRAVGSGQYFYRMKGPSWAEAGKLFVVK